MSNAVSPTENLTGSSAISKIKEIAESASTCFFTTKKNNESESRPMALQGVDEQGSLWFLSDINSEKNKAIEVNPSVELYFINNSKYEYVFVKGKATISKDKSLIQKYWTDFAKAWFEGPNDPNLSLIEVKAQDGYYYETKENKLVAASKMLFAAITGKKVEDGGIEGQLDISQS